MKPQHLLLALPVATAYSLAGQQRTFIGTKLSGPQHKPSIVMDTETNALDPMTKYHVEKTLQNINLGESSMTLEEVEAVHGMPWQSSIDKSVED